MSEHINWRTGTGRKRHDAAAGAAARELMEACRVCNLLLLTCVCSRGPE